MTDCKFDFTLFLYYQVYSDMIAERRKRVTNGVEDIYGWKKTQ